MDVKNFLDQIGIHYQGTESREGAYVIDLLDSDDYGRVYSILENCDELEIMYDNQVITEQGSSLMYEADAEPYILNLIADFDEDKYQLIVNRIGD